MTLLHGTRYNFKCLFLLELSAALIKNIFSNIMNILFLKKIEEAVYKWKSESLGRRPLASPLFYTNNWVPGRGPHEACSPFWTHSSVLQGASLAADCLNDSSGVHSSTAPQRKPHLIWPGLAVAQAPVQQVDGNILSHFHFLAFRAIWGHLLFAY